MTREELMLFESVLGTADGGPSISRENGQWILYTWTDAPVTIEILAAAEDWSKFVELCRELYWDEE